MVMTCLDGTLCRRPDGTWRWADGQAEPRVRDLSPDEWGFRCRAYGTGNVYAEVPLGLAAETDSLAWVVDGWRAGMYRLAQSGDHTGPRIAEAGGCRRLHTQPGEDPMLGCEPMPESRGPIPAVILVPIADWDSWVAAHPAGAAWDAADEPAILDRAYALGWRPAEAYRARSGRVYAA
jgi:hypothetical protein